MPCKSQIAVTIKCIDDMMIETLMLYILQKNLNMFPCSLINTLNCNLINKINSQPELRRFEIFQVSSLFDITVSITSCST